MASVEGVYSSIRYVHFTPQSRHQLSAWGFLLSAKADISSVWKVKTLGRCKSSLDGECP